MSTKRTSWPKYITGLARMILHSREMRRKMLFQLVIALVVIVALGGWPLSKWLSENVWYFLLWWGACLLYTVMIILLAIYDMLAVIKEERSKH